jgi:hypothetical protein
MLLHADQERALSYLAACLDQVASFGDILQLVIVELIYKVSLKLKKLYQSFNSVSSGVSRKPWRALSLHQMYLFAAQLAKRCGSIRGGRHSGHSFECTNGY